MKSLHLSKGHARDQIPRPGEPNSREFVQESLVGIECSRVGLKMGNNESASDDSLSTRASLLGRLRTLEDEESWRRFFNLYWKLMYNVARRAGLDVEAAQDVVQETVICVARRIPGFEYDPARGTFRQWLLRIVRRRIADTLRKKYREGVHREFGAAALYDNPAAAQVADPAEGLEQIWDQEWERAIFEAAVTQVRQKVNAKQFQIFDYSVLKGWPAAKVAATLGLNSAQVYLARHRVSHAVRRAARALAADDLR
jgi:RNA polymerase sigma factor (sigma-70 family)